jgi:hypothetical protein
VEGSFHEHGRGVNESDYKRRLVKAVNALPGGWARRVEDRYAVNVLDMIIKLPGHPMFMAEGKIITGNLFGPTPGQFEEGCRLQEAAIRPLLIGWKLGIMYISPWIKKAEIRECFSSLESSTPLDHLTALRAYLSMKENPQ